MINIVKEEHFEEEMELRVLDSLENSPKSVPQTAVNKLTTPSRDKWPRSLDFLITLVGHAVGLGNMWRFPYLCYKNGGGAFLVPYLLCAAVGAFPIHFLEIALGQLLSIGTIGVWKICPIFKGIGYGTMIILGVCINLYYIVIVAWAFHYLFASLTSRLPWMHCDNVWNTDACVSSRQIVGNITEKQKLNGTDVMVNFGLWRTKNATEVDSSPQNSTDATVEYWRYRVLRISPGIDFIGDVQWDLALCLLLTWCIVYLCIYKGIKSSSKVAYVTSTLPYVLLFILLCRGVTLPGSLDGLKYFIVPDWSQLANGMVWRDAGTQVLFSLVIGMGVLPTLGSFNKFHHNCLRDSILLCCINCGTSLLAGFVIFSVLGFMAHIQGVSVSDVADSGPGLAFVVYPQAVAQMPLAPLWSVLFFLTIIFLGLDSQFVSVEAFIASIIDVMPSILRKGRRQEIFAAIVCTLSYLIGLIMVTNGGAYFVRLFDFYCMNSAYVFIFLFCMVLSWIYGINRLASEISKMLGTNINIYLKICWSVLSPLYCLALFTLTFRDASDVTYDKHYHYPKWAVITGQLIGWIPLTMLPLIMVIKLSKEKGSFITRLKRLLWPPKYQSCAGGQAEQKDDTATCINQDVITREAKI